MVVSARLVHKALVSLLRSERCWRPVRVRPKTELTALIAVAAPTNLADYELADVDLEAQIVLAREHLAIDIETCILGRDQALTEETLLEELRQSIDISCLVSHGALTRSGIPILYLQNASGEVQVSKADVLTQRIAELTQTPRLAVLVSCENAAVRTGPIVELLLDTHLVRAEKRAGATWYKLAHDRMVVPIRNNNND